MSPPLSLATMSSHSSFYNIIPGALAEELQVYAVCLKRDRPLWIQHPHITDNITLLSVPSTEETDAIVETFNTIDDEVLIIPHGSFVRYLSKKDLEKIRHPIFGGTKILSYEAIRQKNSGLLKKAGLQTPKVFSSIDEIDRPVIIKLHGAEGGKGYFVAESKKEVKEKQTTEDSIDFIQEYISGVSIYAHYFSSPILERCELLGFDRRLESNVNAQHLTDFDEPSFTVVGNVPIVVRESLVPEYQRIGEAFVDHTGIVGPFCIETICTPELAIYAFEFSGRIVAGTTVWVPHGSTYANVLWGEEMYMGKRIAREIKLAMKKKETDKLFIDSPKLQEV
ncbi:MAG: formate--phosphoribosylaminoimidazolecarboxamide ligase [Asgard group archaeon]|nr:formate--phosphoribosylaminoimidazolecarboxamide ligase [Asgard group archaeon]